MHRFPFPFAFVSHSVRPNGNAWVRACGFCGQDCLADLTFRVHQHGAPAVEIAVTNGAVSLDKTVPAFVRFGGADIRNAVPDAENVTLTEVKVKPAAAVWSRLETLIVLHIHFLSDVRPGCVWTHFPGWFWFVFSFGFGRTSPLFFRFFARVKSAFVPFSRSWFGNVSGSSGGDAGTMWNHAAKNRRE